MKKILTFFVTFILLLQIPMLISCGNKKGNLPDNDQTDDMKNVVSYEQLYDGNAKQKYDVVDNGELTRASYGYMFNDLQGYNNWYYVEGEPSNYTALSYTAGVWEGQNGTTFSNGVFSCTTKAGYIFHAKITANYQFQGTFKKALTGGGNITLCVYKNDQKLLDIGDIIVDEADTIGRYFSGSINLEFGDELYFAIQGSNAYLNPTITTKSLNDSLYTTRNPWGAYGDVHAYYHDNTVNLYHLWNHGGDLQWQWYRKTSTDMFRFYDADYDTSFVQDHYMSYDRSPDLIDYNQYIGGRDVTNFYDEEVDKRRFITLSYKTNTPGNVNCDLTLRTSLDSIGFDWSNPSIVLRSFPNNSGEPECSGIRKIGNRWYLYTGISGQSVHGIGRLSYWVGGENQTIDQVDWQNLPTNHLDGEDLCVPQIENIGGRFYLYGWMPKIYNAYHWGGPMNLPREVFARSNGLLGSRLDQMATKLVNKGKMFDVTKDIVNALSGSVLVNSNNISMTGKQNSANLSKTTNASFVTFNLDMKNSTEAGFTMTANGREYRLSLIKEADGVYMQIGCPKDPTHPVSSKIYYGDLNQTKFSIKAVIDGDVVEFYVDDTMALSGRTSMTEKEFTPGFYSNAQAEFTDITINRLAQFYDVYD